MAKIRVLAHYVSSMNSFTLTFDEKNFDQVAELEDSLEVPLQTDDFALDQVDVDGVDIKGLDWNDILIDGYRMNEEVLASLFEEGEEYFVKLSFVVQSGYDIGKIDLEDIYVYDASKDNKVYGNHSSEYPDGLIDEWAEIYYPDLQAELQKAKADSYFEWARVFSDNEVNGDFTCEWIGDYFVYMYN
jgi:hypothetical protein